MFAKNLPLINHRYIVVCYCLSSDRQPFTHSIVVELFISDFIISYLISSRIYLKARAILGHSLYICFIHFCENWKGKMAKRTRGTWKCIKHRKVAFFVTFNRGKTIFIQLLVFFCRFLYTLKNMRKNPQATYYDVNGMERISNEIN